MDEKQTNSADPITLVIDGNNLAHYLYPHLTHGTKMTCEDSHRLIQHLSGYALTFLGLVQIDLCLDLAPCPLPQTPGSIRVLGADYPQNGDDLLIGRFWYYHIGGFPCLVITNDNEVQDEVEEARGSWMKVSDFVRRTGLVNPVFRSPAEMPVPIPPTEVVELGKSSHSLNASIYFRITTDVRSHSSQATLKPHATKSEPDEAKQTQPAVNHLDDAQIILDMKEEFPGKQAAHPQQSIAPRIPADQSPDDLPYYSLTFDRWPVVESARLLVRAFCPAHLDEYRDLIDTVDFDHLTPADVRALAELLLFTCGDEPEFSRSGPLMTRVRLALLKARGEPLGLFDLAQQTGLKPHGLRGRIKAKASPWLEILPMR